MLFVRTVNSKRPALPSGTWRHLQHNLITLPKSRSSHRDDLGEAQAVKLHGLHVASAVTTLLVALLAPLRIRTLADHSKASQQARDGRLCHLGCPPGGEDACAV